MSIEQFKKQMKEAGYTARKRARHDCFDVSKDGKFRFVVQYHTIEKFTDAGAILHWQHNA